MNKKNEISNIQLQLKIPISDIEFKSETVEIFSEKTHIGSISLINSSSSIKYNMTPEAVNWLNWGKIYSLYKNQIDALIYEKIGLRKIKITLGTFRNLYIKDENENLICIANCIFENIWKVEINYHND